MHPMGPVCLLGAHLCPLGLKCTPPLKTVHPFLCVCALGFFYFPWGSCMFLGGSFMLLGALLCSMGSSGCLFKSARPPYAYAPPSYVRALGLFYAPRDSSALPPLGVHASSTCALSLAAAHVPLLSPAWPPPSLGVHASP
jgi:hypothetical protein